MNVLVRFGNRDVSYTVKRYDDSLITISRTGDELEYTIFIPRQFSLRLYSYDEGRFEQFFATHLLKIITFANLNFHIFPSGTTGSILCPSLFEIHENDERVVEFFEDILSSLHPQTKSAR